MSVPDQAERKIDPRVDPERSCCPPRVLISSMTDSARSRTSMSCPRSRAWKIATSPSPLDGLTISTPALGRASAATDDVMVLPLLEDPISAT